MSQAHKRNGQSHPNKTSLIYPPLTSQLSNSNSRLTPLPIIDPLDKDIILRINIKRLSINLIPARRHTKIIQKIRILLQRRALKHAIRPFIIARDKRGVVVARPARTTVRFLHAQACPVVLGDVGGVGEGGFAPAPGVGGGAAELGDAVAAGFEGVGRVRTSIEVGFGDGCDGAGLEHGEVRGVGVPVGL